MSRPLRLLLVLAAAAAGLLAALEPRPESPQARVPPLPAEAAVEGAGAFCAQELPGALEDTFRWVAQPNKRVWRRGLTVVCDAGSQDSARLAVLEGKTAVWRGTVAREAGSEGDALAAAVAARLLWERPEVAGAAVRAFLANQPDVARAGADLWRERRWAQAADTLYSALENDWSEPTEAQLYFGLAESEAHLGRPRQAFWYALAYAALSDKQPPESWLRALRGAAALLAEQPPTVDPKAQELVREAASLRRGGDLAGAFGAMRSLCRLAPWSDEYQLEVAAVYDRLGWRPLADSWKRRAALTRRLASDPALQARVAALLR